jgi:hypothetical protein
MPKPKLQEEKQEHKHRWIEGGQNTWYCDQDDCRLVRITQDEYDRRIEEWDNYYQFVQTTESYQDFVAMRKAFFERNKPEIDLIIKRAKERLEANNYHAKPNFADPRDRKYEITE